MQNPDPRLASQRSYSFVVPSVIRRGDSTSLGLETASPHFKPGTMVNPRRCLAVSSVVLPFSYFQMHANCGPNKVFQGLMSGCICRGWPESGGHSRQPEQLKAPKRRRQNVGAILRVYAAPCCSCRLCRLYRRFTRRSM